jgi:rhodanese-related sulfurtransferase
MKTTRLLLSSALIPILTACASTAVDVDVPTAKARIASGSQVLDVRTLEEWNEGHLKNAIRIDIKQPGFAEAAAKQLDPGRPLLVYCRSGARSAKAVGMLEKQGFTRIENLSGGILAWKAAAEPLVHP